MLVVVVISGIIVAALASSFVVSTRATTSSKDRIDRSRDAQQTSTYFLTDAQNASYFSKDTAPAGLTTCSTFGTGNVGIFEWYEGVVRKNAIYGTTGTPSQLVRRYCENGAMGYDVTLVRNVGTPTPQVTCPTASCSANSLYLEMAVSETSATYEGAYSYTVRADPRPTAAGSDAMAAVAIYVGSGGITTGGSKTTITVDEGTVTVDGESKCNGDNDPSSPAFVVNDGFYPETNTNCLNAGTGTAPSDPLVNVPAPAVPAASATEPTKNNGYTPPNATDCGTSQPTFQPGLYSKDWALENGCLASGTYYFTSGAVLSNVKSAAGGVHIYIADGGGDFSNVTLSPLTTGDQAGITVFQARGATSALKTNDNVTVDGVIYEPDGVLWVQSSSGSLRAGRINVKELRFGGNSDGLIII
jgi:hypothetical protein